MSMFCYQCQETAKGTGCEVRGVCGKNEEVAKLQDLLIYVTKGISEIVVKGNIEVKSISEVNHQVLKSLFITITNANFDDGAIENQIHKMIGFRNELKKQISGVNLGDASEFEVSDRASMLDKASKVGVLSTENEDVRSLREMIIYGLKGMAAYTHHALNIGKEDLAINAFIYEALASTLDDSLSADDLVALTLKTGEFGVKAMALLDDANTSKYGNPEITSVNIGVRNNPGILISGHDLTDLEQLLEQTKGTGIDVYTHSEMLPAHGYPGLNQYPHLAGNFGTAWQSQQQEFQDIPAPVLFTTNCLMPQRPSYQDRIYTTSVVGYEGLTHIEADEHGHKDFSPVIRHALRLGGYERDQSMSGINGGHMLTTGFAHAAVLSCAPQLVEAIKTGAIRHIFLVGGCDGAHPGRNYYTEFVKQAPMDSIVLTLACGKYRFNDLDLGEINGIPRILDMGQCNDAYSAIYVAQALAEIFGCGINELPLTLVLSWYEQKAVCILLTLLALGVKNIYLGPTLPAFLSESVVQLLVHRYSLTPITAAPQDLDAILGRG